MGPIASRRITSGASRACLTAASLIVATILAGACADDVDTIDGSGDRVTRSFDLDEFSALASRGAFLHRLLLIPLVWLTQPPRATGGADAAAGAH